MFSNNTNILNKNDKIDCFFLTGCHTTDLFVQILFIYLAMDTHI
jgi:hypothetical protein